MSVNVALLRQTMDYIEAHPEEWDQRVWSCGTTACFAGWAVKLSGIDIDAAVCDMGGGVTASVGIVAQELLGITDKAADALFSGCNRMGDLLFYVDALSFPDEA